MVNKPSKPLPRHIVEAYVAKSKSTKQFLKEKRARELAEKERKKTEEGGGTDK